jgi:predicted TIM-barrel fold metal-dependent hydrolase
MPLDRFQELAGRHLASVRGLLPDGARMWDAHTHLGVDEDGLTQSPEELLLAMRDAGVERAFTFPLNDPERVPAYRTPNDRVMEWCAAAPEQLVPFCRLDLTDDPIGEATRCLDRGARGIKLHPRAQRFTFGERALDPVFAIAAERRVPILIHAGRGLPPIADDLLHLVDRHPAAQLILAHAAIADLQHIGRVLVDVPNVVYDTSVWAIVDLRTLLATVSPQQVAWASDAPYGQPATAAFQMAHVLRTSGASERIVRDVFWGTAERVARGEPADRLSQPLLARTAEVSLQRQRISDYLITTTSLLWLMQPDMPGAIGLALRACDVEGSPELGEVAELIEAAGELWTEGLAQDEPEQVRPYTRGAFRLLQIAMTLLHAP